MMQRLPLIEKLAKPSLIVLRLRRQMSNVNLVPESHGKSDADDGLGIR